MATSYATRGTKKLVDKKISENTKEFNAVAKKIAKISGKKVKVTRTYGGGSREEDNLVGKSRVVELEVSPTGNVKKKYEKRTSFVVGSPGQKAYKERLKAFNLARDKRSSVIIRDHMGRVTHASSKVLQYQPNIIGKKLGDRQAMMVSAGISGLITKGQAKQIIARGKIKSKYGAEINKKIEQGKDVTFKDLLLSLYGFKKSLASFSKQENAFFASRIKAINSAIDINRKNKALKELYTKLEEKKPSKLDVARSAKRLEFFRSVVRPSDFPLVVKLNKQFDYLQSGGKLTTKRLGLIKGLLSSFYIMALKAIPTTPLGKKELLKNISILKKTFLTTKGLKGIGSTTVSPLIGTYQSLKEAVTFPGLVLEMKALNLFIKQSKLPAAKVKALAQKRLNFLEKVAKKISKDNKARRKDIANALIIQSFLLGGIAIKSAATATKALFVASPSVYTKVLSAVVGLGPKALAIFGNVATFGIMASAMKNPTPENVGYVVQLSGLKYLPKTVKVVSKLPSKLKSGTMYLYKNTYVFVSNSGKRVRITSRGTVKRLNSLYKATSKGIKSIISRPALKRQISNILSQIKTTETERLRRLSIRLRKKAIQVPKEFSIQSTRKSTKLTKTDVKKEVTKILKEIEIRETERLRKLSIELRKRAKPLVDSIDKVKVGKEVKTSKKDINKEVTKILKEIEIRETQRLRKLSIELRKRADTLPETLSTKKATKTQKFSKKEIKSEAKKIVSEIETSETKRLKKISNNLRKKAIQIVENLQITEKGNIKKLSKTEVKKEVTKILKEIEIRETQRLKKLSIELRKKSFKSSTKSSNTQQYRKLSKTDIKREVTKILKEIEIRETQRLKKLSMKLRSDINKINDKSNIIKITNQNGEIQINTKTGKRKIYVFKDKKINKNGKVLIQRVKTLVKTDNIKRSTLRELLKGGDPSRKAQVDLKLELRKTQRTRFKKRQNLRQADNTKQKSVDSKLKTRQVERRVYKVQKTIPLTKSAFAAMSTASVANKIKSFTKNVAGVSFGTSRFKKVSFSGLSKLKSNAKPSMTISTDTRFNMNKILTKINSIASTAAKQDIKANQASKQKPISKTKTKKTKTPIIPKLKLTWKSKIPKGYSFKANYRVKIGTKARLYRVGLTPNRAIKMALDRVDRSLARSFDIIVSGVVKSKDIKMPSKIRKFRMRRGKDPRVLTFVEKAKYALDSPLEKARIKRAKRVKRK